MSGKTVLIAPGTLTCDGFITPQNDIVLAGSGMMTNILFKAESNVGIRVAPASGATINRFLIRDMILNGQQAADNNNSTGLIHIIDGVDFDIDNIRLLNGQSCGLNIIGSTPVTAGVTAINRGRIRRVFATGCSRGGIEIYEGKHLELDFITCVDNCVNESAVNPGNSLGHEINLEVGEAEDRILFDVKLTHVYCKTVDNNINRKAFSLWGHSDYLYGISLSDFRLEGGTYGFHIGGAGHTLIQNGVITGPTNGLTVAETSGKDVVDFMARGIRIANFTTRGLWLGAATAGDNWTFDNLDIDGNDAASTTGLVVHATNNITHAYLNNSKIHDVATYITDAASKIRLNNVVTWT